MTYCFRNRPSPFLSLPAQTSWPGRWASSLMGTLDGQTVILPERQLSEITKQFPVSYFLTAPHSQDAEGWRSGYCRLRWARLGRCFITVKWIRQCYKTNFKNFLWLFWELYPERHPSLRAILSCSLKIYFPVAWASASWDVYANKTYLRQGRSSRHRALPGDYNHRALDQFDGLLVQCARLRSCLLILADLYYTYTRTFWSWYIFIYNV